MNFMRGHVCKNVPTRVIVVNMEKKSSFVYAVVARRFGDEKKHSYVIGVWSDHADAVEAAQEHERYRGGKYECKVQRLRLDGIDDPTLTGTDSFLACSSGDDFCLGCCHSKVHADALADAWDEGCRYGTTICKGTDPIPKGFKFGANPYR